MDFQVRVESWPEPGKTIVSRESLMAGGGKAANVACIARRMGVETLLVGRIGDDGLGAQAIESLDEIGVDLEYTREIKNARTGTAMITVGPDGEKIIVFSPNANDAWPEQDENDVASAIADSPPGSILIADLEITGSIVRKALITAREYGLPVILDPSPAPRMEAGLYGYIDYITPNPAEAENLTGIAVKSIGDAFKAGEVLISRGVKTALIKLGAKGCVIISRDIRVHVPTIKVEAIDKTGAGDAFAGALGVGLFEGKPISQAGQYATVAAALAITKFGTQNSYPFREELEANLRRL